MAIPKVTEETVATVGRFLFGVLLQAAGSLTIGEHRIQPFQVTPVPRDLAEEVDTDVNPVRFHETEEAAAKHVADLKAAELAKKQPRPQ